MNTNLLSMCWSVTNYNDPLLGPSRSKDRRLVAEQPRLKLPVRWLETEPELWPLLCTPSPGPNTAASQVAFTLLMNTQDCCCDQLRTLICFLLLRSQKSLQRRWESPSQLRQQMEKQTRSSSATWLKFWSWRKVTYLLTRLLKIIQIHLLLKEQSDQNHSAFC